MSSTVTYSAVLPVDRAACAGRLRVSRVGCEREWSVVDHEGAVKGKTSRETVYYATDLRIGPDLTPAALAYAIRRHWAIENSSHHVRDRSFAEDACTTRTGTAPQALAAVRNLAIGLLHCADEPNIARALRRYNRDEPATLQPLGITPQQD